MTLEITSCLCMCRLYPKSLYFFTSHWIDISKRKFMQNVGFQIILNNWITGLQQLSPEQIKQCCKVHGKSSSFWWRWWDVVFPISPRPAGQRSTHHPRWQKLDKLHDPCLQKPKAITVVELTAGTDQPFQPQFHKMRRGEGRGGGGHQGREGERMGKGKRSLLSTWKYFENFEQKKYVHEC